MAKVEIVETLNEKMITVWIEKKLGFDALAEAVELAKHEVAKKLWDEHRTEIMEKINLTGLAKLIAVYAAKDLSGVK